MNKNEALQWLVVNLKQWPAVTSPLTQPPKSKAGHWKIIDGEFRFTGDWSHDIGYEWVITCNNWLTAVDHARAIDPNISDEEYGNPRSIVHEPNEYIEMPSVKDAQPMVDMIKSPKYYQIIDGIESITIIASGLTIAEWRGFCLGNILKYRIRADKKDMLEQDIAKANEYESLFERYKGLCRHD